MKAVSAYKKYVDELRLLLKKEAPAVVFPEPPSLNYLFVTKTLSKPDLQTLKNAGLKEPNEKTK